MFVLLRRRLLIQCGADPNAVCRLTGDTVIHFGVRSRREGVVRLLLGFRADPLVENLAGKTAVDVAAEKQLGSVVVALEDRAAYAGNVEFRVRN